MSIQLTGAHSKPHDGTIANYTEKQYYRCFGGYWIDGNAITIDHLVHSDETITVEANGTNIEEL